MSVGLVVAIAAAGLVGLTGPSVHAAQVLQDGPVNYVGPGPCPTDATDCTIATGNVDVVQTAPSIGRNEADCRGDTCAVDQKGTLATDKPANTAACKNATTAGTSAQRCEIHQKGGTNTINADFAASPTTGGVVNLSNVTQFSAERFITSQDGTTNALNVKGAISQTANSSVDATTPVNHTQRTLIRSLSTMNATVKNTADYNLSRSQTSSATGATPTQLQDNALGSEADGAVVGLGQVGLAAKSVGTNSIKVRATDTKNENATSLNLGQATQQQGHATGGWLVDLSGTDSGAANSGGAPDIDLGTPGTTDGVTKTWTQHAQGVLGGSIAKDQDQIDQIKIPVIGKSPFKITSSAKNTLTTDDGGHQLCGATSTGHAKTNWTGKLACDMHAGAKVKTPSVSFSGTDIDASVACEQNTDACPGGTVKPVSHTHMAVRNVTTGEAYTGDEAPGATSAKVGQVVEYKGTIHNAGSGGATGATLASTVPAGTTFVSCSNTCAQTGTSVSWNIGSLVPGGVASRTFQIQLGSAAPNSFTNKVTGDDNEENAFDSNTTTVNVTRPTTVGIKIFGASAGKYPVAILSTPDFNAATVNPNTVCFGEPDPALASERDCTLANDGTSMTDVDNDGDLDLKMHFDVAQTGIDSQDKTACLTGRTYDGADIEGCGPLNK